MFSARRDRHVQLQRDAVGILEHVGGWPQHETGRGLRGGAEPASRQRQRRGRGQYRAVGIA